MKEITDGIRQDHGYRDVCHTLLEQKGRQHPAPVLVTGLCDGARLAFYASLIADYRAENGKGTLLIVPDEKDGLRLNNAFTDLGLRALTYPVRDMILHPVTASHEYEQERLKVLTQILWDQYDVIIATPEAALQLTIPLDILHANTQSISLQISCNQENLIEKLMHCGYVRNDLVDAPGQFSVRGGILDVFSPQMEYPVRIDFFGDEIEQMGTFDPMTQRRIEQITEFAVIPAREVLLDINQRGALMDFIRMMQKKAVLPQAKEQLAMELTALQAGNEPANLDKYITFLYPQATCLLDYFGRENLRIVQEYSAVKERIHGSEGVAKQTVKTLAEEGILPSKYALYCRWQEDFDAGMETCPCVVTELFSNGMAGRRLSGMISFTTKQMVSYAGRFDLLLEDLLAYQRGKFRCVVLCETISGAQTLQQSLYESGVSSSFTEDVPGTVRLLCGVNLPGYEMTRAQFACLSMYENPNALARTLKLRNRRRGTKRQSSQERILSYADLKVGDYVVHIHHGIGRYQGIETLTVGGVTKDFIKIQYAGTDVVYLPCNQLDAVSKYIGADADSDHVKLSKLGGAEWQKATAKAKTAAKAMAKELIALYAQRMRRPGFAFTADDDMQREFESAFEYEETEGQLQSAEEIKRDMEQARPMERLLCGDVGFGKTEVALRAAFKAVMSHKQVAVLVPTTILAMQHYQTFTARMRNFPVQVDMISRFRNSKQQEESLRKLRRGETDIIIGTHRLISKDVEFKDLGLVIIDEEQRFGVAHKEKLKQITENVDSLTLTATPIPRTLNMAMSGIRDMSILEEAPLDRLPVQSYVLEYDELIILDAIRKELRRGGQVFYLYNRTETIADVAARLSAALPDARIAYAHGKMDKEDLSDIWGEMVAGNLDILVSTTIIETGIDVPNANTLIIEHADAMGLSQLHQLRGRVGRSGRRAYAYFTYPKGKVLTEISEKRLSAIRDFTEFGSGFKVAMRDLEIRGAGNLLGAEQHGHIASVGYELYMRILNEAILEERGETKPKLPDCVVEMNLSAYIPETYITSAPQRIDVYRRIALIENVADYRDVMDELLDRYGEIPRVTMHLLQIALLRAYGKQCRIARVEFKSGTVLCYPVPMKFPVWTKLAMELKGKLLINAGVKPYISYRVKDDLDLPEATCKLFEEYLKVASANEGGVG